MDLRAFYDDYWRRAPGGRDAARRREADADALDFLKLRDGLRVLDLGIGTGGSSRAMAGRGCRVVALDLSFEALVLARRAFGPGERGRILLVRADAHRLPFRDGTFERAALFSVMMFLEPSRFLPELRRTLAPGFRISLVEPLATNPFLRIWRFAVRTYHGAARWKEAGALIESVRRSFRIVETQGYYLCPAIALLPDGALRRGLLRCEEKTLDALLFLKNRAWIMRIGATE